MLRYGSVCSASFRRLLQTCQRSVCLETWIICEGNFWRTIIQSSRYLSNVKCLLCSFSDRFTKPLVDFAVLRPSQCDRNLSNRMVDAMWSNNNLYTYRTFRRLCTTIVKLRSHSVTKEKFSSGTAWRSQRSLTRCIHLWQSVWPCRFLVSIAIHSFAKCVATVESIQAID